MTRRKRSSHARYDGHRFKRRKPDLSVTSKLNGSGQASSRFDRIHKNAQYLHMRTNIDIDDTLMAQAMRASEKPTKRAVVEEALRLLVRTKRQTRIRKWRGKVAWEGDLHVSRAARVLD
jgi:Arc/MetJ family transcription regulator